GGTKWVCATGTGPTDVHELVTFPTTDPAATIARAADFFAGDGALAAIGVGSFGPIDVKRSSPTWGRITTTPKPGWADTDVVAALKATLDLPLAFDTDVNAAALGEHRWGAAVGLETFCYVTVGTGIGGGGIVNGELMHGLIHPPSSSTCGSGTTAPATQSPASVPITATASKGSRRAMRCIAAGAG